MDPIWFWWKSMKVSKVVCDTAPEYFGKRQLEEVFEDCDDFYELMNS